MWTKIHVKSAGVIANGSEHESLLRLVLLLPSGHVAGS